MTHVCKLCGEPKTIREMAANKAHGYTRLDRCKVCVNEQSKASQRQQKWFPRFQRLLREVPDLWLANEILWLRKKLDAAEHEAKRRLRKRGRQQ